MRNCTLGRVRTSGLCPTLRRCCLRIHSFTVPLTSSGASPHSSGSFLLTVGWMEKKYGVALTFLRSSAASSFFWISSNDGSRRRGREALNSGTPSKEGGFRMTSKDWPEVHLLSSMTSMSEMTHQFRSTVSAVEGRGGAAHPPRSSWGPNEHAHMHTDTGDLRLPGHTSD